MKSLILINQKNNSRKILAMKNKRDNLFEELENFFEKKKYSDFFVEPIYNWLLGENYDPKPDEIYIIADEEYMQGLNEVFKERYKREIEWRFDKRGLTWVKFKKTENDTKKS